MSFLPINEENKEAPQGQTTNAPSTAPPQVSGSAGGGTNAPKGASTGSPTQFGSSASKLGDYLSANAPQITQQANTLAGNLNQTYGNVSQGITNAANQFGQQVQGGYAAPFSSDQLNQAVTNPVQYTATPSNVTAFQGQLNDAYTGPLAFESTSPYSDIQNQVSQAVQQGNLLSTPAGLQSYLQSQGTNPTQASNTLDTLLMQGSPQAQATIQNAANQFGNLTGQFNTAVTNADALVPQAIGQANQAQTAAQGALSGAQQGLTSQINQALTAAEAIYGQNNVYNQIRYAIQNGQPISTQQAAAIGIDPTAYNQTLGVAGNANTIYSNIPKSLAAYFTPGQALATAPTAANITTPDQFATMNALNQLAGQNLNFPVDLSQASQAGQYNPAMVAPSFDLSGAQSGVRNAFSSADLNQFKSWDPYPGAAVPYITAWPQAIKDVEDRLWQAGLGNLPAYGPSIIHGGEGYGSNPNVY